MTREEWELYRERWHQHNVETNLSQWLKAKELGLESSICSVEGCLRDAIGFMWADEEDIQALKDKPGLIDENKKRAEELKDELQKCIFHTDKENEIWIENWDKNVEIEKQRELELIKQLYLESSLDNYLHIRVNMYKYSYKWNLKKSIIFWYLIKYYRDIIFNVNIGRTKAGIDTADKYNFTEFKFLMPISDNSYHRDIEDYIDDTFDSLGDIIDKIFPIRYSALKTIFRKSMKNFALNMIDLVSRPCWYIEDKNADIVRKSLYFKGATFSSKIAVFGCKFLHGVDFGGSIFLGGADIDLATFYDESIFARSAFVGKLTLLGTKFNDTVYFTGAVFIDKTLFSLNTFKLNIDFNEAKFMHNVEFSKSEFFGKIDFSESIFGQKLIFNDCKILNELRIIDSTINDSIIIKNINIEIDEINDKFRYDSHLIISNIEFNKDSKIIIENAKFKSLTISEINHRIASENFIIYNLDISDPNGTINFENVYLEDLKFVNVNWGEVSPKRISRELYERDPRAARDIYRQIKLALDKQENYIDARKFYALELQAHGRELEMEIRDSGLPVISWVFGKIIDVSGRLLYSQNTLRTVRLQITATLLRLLGVSLYLIPVLLIFLLLSYHTSLAPIIFFLLLFFLTIPHHRFRTISALNSLVIYYLYGLTANFGLSWLRPLMWLIGTVSAYTYVKNRVDRWGEFVSWVFPEKFVPIVSKISENLNQFASNFLQFLPNQNLYDKEEHSFLTLVFFILSSYLIYQTIVALRRRVRR